MKHCRNVGQKHHFDKQQYLQQWDSLVPMDLQNDAVADNSRFPDVRYARCREADWLVANRLDLRHFWHRRQLVECSILTLLSRSESSFNFCFLLSVNSVCLQCIELPSVLWHCWLGVRKSIWPVKIEWWGVCMVICWTEVLIVCIWSSWCRRHPQNPSCLVLLKFRMIFFCGVGLSRLSWKSGR